MNELKFLLSEGLISPLYIERDFFKKARHNPDLQNYLITLIKEEIIPFNYANPSTKNLNLWHSLILEDCGIVVEHLIKNGFDINTSFKFNSVNESPFSFALSQRSEEVIKLLFKYNYNFSRDADVSPGVSGFKRSLSSSSDITIPQIDAAPTLIFAFAISYENSANTINLIIDKFNITEKNIIDNSSFFNWLIFRSPHTIPLLLNNYCPDFKKSFKYKNLYDPFLTNSAIKEDCFYDFLINSSENKISDFLKYLSQVTNGKNVLTLIDNIFTHDLSKNDSLTASGKRVRHNLFSGLKAIKEKFLIESSLNVSPSLKSNKI